MTTIKKILALSLCLVFVFGCLAGCTPTQTETTKESTEKSSKEPAEESTETPISSQYVEYYLLPNEASYGVKIETNENLTELVIPSTYQNKPVTEVRAFVFKGSEKLKSVTIPEGITDIFIFALSDCSSLKSIMLPRSTQYIYLDLGFKSTELRTIYYAGTKNQWNQIDIEVENYPWDLYWRRPEMKYLGE